jgi:GR25 family glycosyltransferase involved in LPS biosynthesis
MHEQISVRIINLPHRTDRRDECIIEARRIGFQITQHDFFAARHIEHNGKLGCALSHGKVLADFLHEDSRDYILVLEDDFSIRNPDTFRPTLDSLIAHAPNWDVYLLGHNTAIPIEGTPIGNTYKIINAQTTSGYLVGRSYAPNLIKSFFRSADLLSRHESLPHQLRNHAYNVFSCDMLWKELQIEHRYWASLPSLIWQRPSYSDIEKTQVNYGS